MTNEPVSNGNSLPVFVLERIDRVCLAFESGWRAGQTPRIEEFLLREEGMERSQLLCELLLLELDYRVRRDEHPTPEEYEARFPQDTQLVSQAFERLSTAATAAPSAPNRSGVFPQAPALPTRFGDYELLEVLGEGGMGIVYRARQRTPDRVVALKVIRPERLAAARQDSREMAIERFRREVEASARLEHDNIVPVYDAGDVDGQPYLVMRYVDGCGLDETLRHGPIPGREAAALLERVARAVHYAHGRDVVHRDIKPRNILLAKDGRPYVVDFGLAKSLAAIQEFTQTQDLLGTPAYMSPEQATEPSGVDHRTDVYSMGATLYELLTGRPPFQAATLAETQRHVIETDPVSPRRLNPAVDRDLETICLRCLEKDPGRRYATAEHLADELARHQQGKPIQARPVSRLARAWRWRQRNRSLAALAAVAAMLLLLLATGGPIVAATLATLLNRARTSEQAAQQEAAQRRVERDKARDAESAERQAKWTARHMGYVSDMKRVDYFWDVNNISAVRALLARYLPAANEEDLRGFEWHYWWRQCHRYSLTLRHEQAVQCVAVSPNAQLLAAAERGGTITLWDPATCEAVRRLRVADSDFCALSFSDDGRILAAAWGLYSRVTMWDVVSGEVVFSDTRLPVWNPTLHKIVYEDTPATNVKSKSRSCAAFDYGCQRFAKSFTATTYLGERSGDAGEYRTMKGLMNGTCFLVTEESKQVGTVPMGVGGPEETSAAYRVWSLADQNAPPPRQRGGPVFCIAFSPDGTRLAEGGSQGAILVWTLTHDDPPMILQGHEGIIWSVAFDPDAATLATAGADGRVILWDVGTGTEKLAIAAHAGEVQSVAFARGGNALVSASVDGAIKFWDTSSGGLIATQKGHEGPLTCLVPMADGQRVVSASEDGTVKVWDVPTGDEQILLQIPSAMFLGVAFSPDGAQLAFVIRNDPADIAALPAGTPSSVNVDKVVLWDRERAVELKHQKLQSIHLDAAACPIFSPDGRLVSVRAELMNVSWMVTGTLPPDIPFESRRLIEDLPMPFRPVGSGAFLPDGQTFAVPDLQAARVILWHVPQGNDRKTLDTHKMFCLDVAVSSDGKTLAAAADSEVQLWDIPSGKLRATLAGHSEFVRCVAFAGDGNTLVSASSDGTIRLWDLAATTTRATLRGHQGGVSWVAISPDDKTVASAGRDGAVRLWDLRYGEEKTTLREHEGPVTSVAFSPDGRTLASTSEDGTLRLWRGMTDDPTISADERVKR